MRILYLDIDTLRPDHLGCYGYHRATSPNIDRLAARGTRFENCYVSDAPCLPSRGSMFTGQFGIHTGIVNHGGLCADPRPIGRDRRFNTLRDRPGLIDCIRQAGYYPVSVSPFAERHSAMWFYAGWREIYNTGKCGMESAEEVTPTALEWIQRNAKKDNWMLHYNIWDPHTPYRVPESFGNPFRDEPLAGWYTEELRQRHWNSYCPHGAQEPLCNLMGKPSGWPRVPDRIASMDDYRRWIDGYDCGIRYADEHVGRVLNALADAGVLDDTMIIVTSDHGENQGELGVYGDHMTADHITSRVPMIICKPGLAGGRVDTALHYQTDVGATIVEMLGREVPKHWDGQSFAESFLKGESKGRDYLVVSQMSWSCQRAVRWGDHIFIRTWHTGFKEYPSRMLFNVAEDPHELNDLSRAQPALADHGQALLEQWTSQMMACSDSQVDPLWTVMAEGGPYHSRELDGPFQEHLRQTGRAHHAEFLERHPTGLVD